MFLLLMKSNLSVLFFSVLCSLLFWEMFVLSTVAEIFPYLFFCRFYSFRVLDIWSIFSRFCVWIYKDPKSFFPYSYLTVVAPFLEKPALSPVNCFALLCPYVSEYIPRVSSLLCWSVWCHCCHNVKGSLNYRVLDIQFCSYAYLFWLFEFICISLWIFLNLLIYLFLGTQCNW